MSVCARDGCESPLPEIAVKNLDPFCSRACAAAHYGAEWEEPEKRVRNPKRKNAGHRLMVEGGVGEGPLTRLQRARIGRDRLARAREGI